MASALPELSMLVTCRDLGATLERAVDSCAPVLRAVSSELLIIDDGSTDATSEVCAALAARYGSIVSIRRHDRPRGLVASCNEGLAAARGTKWLRLDADDELIGEAVVRAYARFAQPYDVAVTDYEIFDQGTGACTRVALEPFNAFQTIACGIVFERATLLKIGGYRPLFWEEYDLLVRLERAGAVRRYLPEVTYRYVRHQRNMTADPRARLEGWRQFVAQWGLDALAGHPEREAIERDLQALEAGADGA